MKEKCASGANKYGIYYNSDINPKRGKKLMIALLAVAVAACHFSIISAQEQQYTYVINPYDKLCTPETTITTVEDCQAASSFLKLSGTVIRKSLENAPYGCFEYENALELNIEVTGKPASDSNPVCKVPGAEACFRFYVT